MRNRNNVKRNNEILDYRVRILLVCEGSKTEPLYFSEFCKDINKLKSSININANKEINISYVDSKYTDPLNLVKFADGIFKYGYLDIVRKNALDEIYIVFDRDDHSKYKDAIDEANSKNKKLKNNFGKTVVFKSLPSNPCFEIWLLLHYRDVNNLPDREELFSELDKKLDGYKKGAIDTYNKTKENICKACERAKRLNAQSDPLSNITAYTGVVEFVERIFRLSKKYSNFKFVFCR